MNEGLWVLAASAVGYGVGSLSPAAAVGRARGVDLSTTGSGNPGATNAGRVLGWPFGVLVGLLDVVKGFLPALAFGAVDPTLALWAGAAAVLGHVTSPILRGRGGRGVATSLGAVLAVQPVWALAALAGFGLTLAVTRWVALASMVAGLVLIAAALVAAESTEQLVWAVFLATVVEIRHVPNLTRWVRSRRA
ncbi:MAG: glycerol-3-phosphate acyltransferase [Actinomycetes bacterium]